MRYMRVEVGARFVWGTGSYIHQRGNLRLGERSGIGSFARIWNYCPITIGDDVVSAGGLSLNTGGHDPATMFPKGGPIRIGDRVWLGMNVTILSGVTIHDDVVIAAGSVVTADIGPKCIAGGVPAKTLKSLERAAGARIWDWTTQEYRILT